MYRQGNVNQRWCLRRLQDSILPRDESSPDPAMGTALTELEQALRVDIRRLESDAARMTETRHRSAFRDKYGDQAVEDSARTPGNLVYQDPSSKPV